MRNQSAFLGLVCLSLALSGVCTSGRSDRFEEMKEVQEKASEETTENPVKIFLAGDVMTGRGLDQILPYPSDPVLYESFVQDAKEYVFLAQGINGFFSYPVDFPYIWGDALEEWKRRAPHVKIVNLETSITKSDDYWNAKGIHYRMHPDNAPVLTAAGIDICSLANNHLLDWGYSGLEETLRVLRAQGIKFAGAGRNLEEALMPAVFETRNGRVCVFSYGSEMSGIPSEWAAASGKPGVNLLEDLSDKTAIIIKETIQKYARPENLTIVSIHWGENWGFDIPRAQMDFAHQLIDDAGVDVVHGHSSHHVKGIEVYKGKLVLYGSGDFVNDYEGIGGYEKFRGDLSLMYFPSLDPSSGKLVRLEMVATTMKQFRVTRASRNDAMWLADTLNREGKQFGTRVNWNPEDLSLVLAWN